MPSRRTVFSSVARGNSMEQSFFVRPDGSTCGPGTATII